MLMGDFFPIKLALIIFPVLSFILTMPFLLYESRVRGYINKLRGFVLYSLILYLVVVVYLAVLPLPDYSGGDLAREEILEYNLKPFSFIRSISENTRIEFKDPTSYRFLLMEPGFLKLSFHLLILIPLGIYLRSYLKRSFKETIVISFLISIFLKGIQFMGSNSVYTSTYRLFNIDEPILNTFSGMIGYYISPLLGYLLPEKNIIGKDGLDLGTDFEKEDGGYLRRLVSYLIDIWILSLLPIDSQDFMGYIFRYFIYFILIIYLSNGQTLGKWLTNIKIVGQEERLKFKEVFLRYSLLFYGYFGINKLINLTIELNESTGLTDYLVIIKSFQIVFNLIVWTHVIVCILTREDLFYEKISQTKTKIIKD